LEDLLMMRTLIVGFIDMVSTLLAYNGTFGQQTFGLPGRKGKGFGVNPLPHLIAAW
jgi:hypothetical protein